VSVPPPTDDDLADVPEDAEFDEAFWREYAVSVAGYREEWVEDLIEDQGVAALVAELNPE
jgi:hypothetical protein